MRLSLIEQQNKPLSVSRLHLNESPLGCSPKVKQFINNSANYIHQYPDPNLVEIRTAIANYHSLSLDQVFFGNGVDEIIYLLTLALTEQGDEILSHSFGFSTYKKAAEACARTYIEPNASGFKLDLQQVLRLVTKKTKIIYITNPVNPLGSYFNYDEIEKF